MRTPLIGLLDCNNFYVSCERVFRPDLERKPVVVLSNNDGCIIARSNEVKALGIKMGVPYFKVQEQLQAVDAVVFSSNFGLYGDISTRVMAIIESFFPNVEIYSIDEAFIDFTGVTEVNKLAYELKKEIYKQVGVPVCIGISHTKTLAKVANFFAKKDTSYEGICILTNEKNIEVALEKIHVSDIWGIGRRSSEKLKNASINTGLELKETDPKWMRKCFTVTGERIIAELNGISCLSIDDIESSRKSLQFTRTFSQNIKEYEVLREKIAYFASRVGEKMRARELKAHHIGVFLRTNGFKTNEPQYKNYVELRLSWPINDDFSLIKVSSKILASLYRKGYAYHKAGVIVHDLVPEFSDFRQRSLFEDMDREKINNRTQNLMKTLDGINQKYGRGTLKVASSGELKNRIKKKNSPQELKLRSHKIHKSPSYTTKWSDLLIVGK